MNAAEIRPTEAAAALEQVRLHQGQAFTTPPFPGWFWPAIGALNVGFTGAVEWGRPVVVALGTVAFVVGLAAIVLTVLRRQPFQLRDELLGARGGMTIAGFVVGLVAVGLGVAFGLHTADVPMPGTIANCVVAVAMVVLGPVLGRRLQRIMSDAALKELA